MTTVIEIELDFRDLPITIVLDMPVVSEL